MAHLTWTLLGISPILQRQFEEGAGKRAECSASTCILVAAWNNLCTQVVLGKDAHTGKEPVNAENAVRTRSVLTSRRNPGTERTPSVNR